MGEGASYKIDKVKEGELARQRYLFTPHLMVAAGYSGWVLLVDEVELVGRYPLKQRAQSYAELARLMGKLEGFNLPGLTCVFTINTDFESAVLEYRNDEERIPAKFQGEGDSLFASQAERGMQLIRRDKKTLDKLNSEMIRDTFEKVRAVYATAYSWEPPTAPTEHAPPATTAHIREYVKRWITEWDLKRLYPDYQPEIEVGELKQDYSEIPEIETPSEDERDDTGPH